MNKQMRAKLVLVELNEIKKSDFTGNTTGLLTLLNEALKDAEMLALETLNETQVEKAS